jgi:hypothetical protein
LESATGVSDRSIADLKGKRKALPPSRWRQGDHSSKPFF